MPGLIDSSLVGEPAPAAHPCAAGERVLVLGVGNVLMGDEGVGVHVMRLLEEMRPVCGVRLLDGGTGGVNLLTEFEEVDDVILIDATRDGSPEGTISLLRPEAVTDLPRGLGAHDFGLKDLFVTAALLGKMPRLHLFTISVEQVRPMCTDLSPAVADTMPRVARSVRALASLLVSPKTLPTPS